MLHASRFSRRGLFLIGAAVLPGQVWARFIWLGSVLRDKEERGSMTLGETFRRIHRIWPQKL
jgi:hypothetical protein